MLDIPSNSLFVKICGITRREDAALCADAGADAIGINFYKGSKRCHPLSQAREWLGSFSGPGHPARVALFVNAQLDEIREACESGLFEAIQLHGDEALEFCAAVENFGLPVIRALAMRTRDDLARMKNHPASAFILDAAVTGAYGGTGQTADWALAAEAVRRFPNTPIFLSGGLTPGNVAKAISIVRPSGVDVASGVESAPGFKDPEKTARFIHEARGAHNSRLIP